MKVAKRGAAKKLWKVISVVTDPKPVRRLYDTRKSAYSEESTGAELLRRNGAARRALEDRQLARELGLDEAGPQAKA